MRVHRQTAHPFPTGAIARDLALRVTGPVIANADLRVYSSWRIGGHAALVVEPASAIELIDVVRYLSSCDLPKLIVGDGSNLLFDDAGFDGVIIRIGPRLAGISVEGHIVRAQSGWWVPRFVRELGRFGLSGLEHAIGIPGTLGGLVYMNGGSQRKSVGTVIRRVTGCDWSGNPVALEHEDCGFRYRGSALQGMPFIIIETTFEFADRDPGAMRREMVEIMASRRRKFPKNLPNCGSVFLSDPKLHAAAGPPGAVIEQAGLAGWRLGGAEISTLHANFIVNRGNARSRDVLGLVRLARERVRERTGYTMDCEVRHVSPDGQVRPAHIMAEAM